MTLTQFFNRYPEIIAVCRDYDDSPIALLGDPTVRMVPHVGYHCCGDPGWDWVGHRGIVAIHCELPTDFPPMGNPEKSLTLRPE